MMSRPASAGIDEAVHSAHGASEVGGDRQGTLRAEHSCTQPRSLRGAFGRQRDCAIDEFHSEGY